MHVNGIFRDSSGNIKEKGREMLYTAKRPLLKKKLTHRLV